MSLYVCKRNGKLEPLCMDKVSRVIKLAIESTGSIAIDSVIDTLTCKVKDYIFAGTNAQITVEAIQDLVEKVLMEYRELSALRNFIIYREKHKNLRTVNSTDLVNSYVGRSDWRVNENASIAYSLGGMILNNSGAITANYWLNEVYSPEIGEAHRSAAFHIHDLSMLSSYCAGHNLLDLIKRGLGGVPGKVTAAPASHLSTLCSQMVNYLGILALEHAGAQAFSSFDTYLAPFVKTDNLSEKEVKQCLQSFIFGVNVPSRWGCVPTTTKVLTIDGWKGHNELSESDQLYTLDSDHKLSVNQCRHVTVKPFKGKLVKLHSEHYGYNQEVTPEHRVLTSYNGIQTADKFLEFKDDPWLLPATHNGLTDYVPVTDMSDEEVELAARLYCDGVFQFRGDRVLHKINYVKSPNRCLPEPINALFDHFELKYNMVESGSEAFGSPVNYWTFYGDSARWLLDLIGGDKFKIADKFLNLNQEQSLLFLKTWMSNDGMISKYNCQCDNLDIRESLKVISIRAGHLTHDYTRYYESGAEGNHLKVCRVRNIRPIVDEVDYDGEVWCPTVDDGVVVFRAEDGSTFISGQSQAPFSNITLDWNVPSDLKDLKCWVGGNQLDFTYGDCQKEVDTINKVLMELFMEGDANGRGFAYPIPTYSITKDFDWESDNAKLLFEMSSKYGIPYFQNFVNSDLEPDMIRSMCPMKGDTLIRTNLGDLPISELDGKVVKVKLIDEWKDARCVKMDNQKCFEVVTEYDTTTYGSNHLQPIVRNQSQLTIMIKDLLVGDYLLFNIDDNIEMVPVIDINNVSDNTDLYCMEVL